MTWTGFALQSWLDLASRLRETPLEMKSIGLFLLLLTLTARAQTNLPPPPPNIIANTNSHIVVKLGWDPSPDVGIAGYQLYRGNASGSYVDQYWAGTNLTYTVSNIVVGTTNYFAVTAVGTNQMESDFSNEVSYGPIPPRAPSLKMQIIVTPQYEGSTNGVSWIPLGDGPEVVFDAPSGWRDGFIRVKLHYREVLATDVQ